ncbi:MAG: hypothetical protein ACOYN3_09185 [Acidimicrobiia bacterium]
MNGAFNLVLASGALVEKTFWYPTLVGVSVVVAAVVLFCGSVYLILSTNIGARLGFIASMAGLSGFMVVLSFLWMTTAYPLNTVKGRPTAWKVVEITSDVANAKTTVVRTIQNTEPVSAAESANVKAAIGEALVAKKKEGKVEPKPLGPVVLAWLKTSGYSISESTDYLTVKLPSGELAVWETKSEKPNPLAFQFTHAPKYAVIEICPTDKAKLKADPPVEVCDTSASAPPAQFIVLEKDLGSLRVPPTVAFIASLLLFGFSLLLLYWWEIDRRNNSSVKGGVQLPVPAEKVGARS